MEKVKFTFPMLVVKAYKDAEDKMHVVAIASDDQMDWDNERFSKDALRDMVASIKDGTVEFLPTHYDSFEMGMAEAASITTGTKLVETYDGLDDYNKDANYLVVDFKLDEAYPQSQTLYREVSTGACKRQLSVGGSIPWDEPGAITWETETATTEDGQEVEIPVRVFNKFELDHIAATREDWAANPRTGYLSAATKAVNKAFGIVKGVIAHSRGYSKAPVDTSWRWNATAGNALIDEGGWKLFKEAHTWFDDEDGSLPEDKGAYKLPHHKFDGGFKVYFRGTVAAMAALMGARGGTKIPSDDRKGVYNHLKRHYKEYDKEPPEFKWWTLDDFITFHSEQGIELVKSELAKHFQSKDEERVTMAEKGKLGNLGALIKRLNDIGQNSAAKGAGAVLEYVGGELKSLADEIAKDEFDLEQRHLDGVDTIVQQLSALRDEFKTALGVEDDKTKKGGETTPEPAAETTPEPAAEATSEATPEAAAEAAAETTPEPAAETTPEPAAEATSEATPEAAAEAAAETTPEPDEKSIKELLEQLLTPVAASLEGVNSRLDGLETEVGGIQEKTFGSKQAKTETSPEDGDGSKSVFAGTIFNTRLLQ